MKHRPIDGVCVLCGASEGAPLDCVPKPLDNRDALRFSILGALYDAALESPHWVQDAGHIARSLERHIYDVTKHRLFHVYVTGKDCLCFTSAFPMDAIPFDPEVETTLIRIQRNPTFETMVEDKLYATLRQLELTLEPPISELIPNIKQRWREYVTRLREGES